MAFARRRAARERRGTSPVRVRERDERGVSLIEFAIVAPTLALLVMAIIDLGFVYNDYVSVRSGARDGARQMTIDDAPVPPGGTSGQRFSCGVTVGGSYGTSVVFSGDTAGLAKGLVCYTKDRIGLGDDQNTRVKIWFNTTNKWVQGQPVTVCAQYPIRSRTGITSIFLSGKVIKTKTEVRLEQPASADSSMVTAAEDPLPGSSWPTDCGAV